MEEGFTAIYSVGGQELKTGWVLTGVIVPTIRFRKAKVDLAIVSDRLAEIEQTASIEASEEIVGVECAGLPGWAVVITQNQPETTARTFQAAIKSQGKLTPGPVADLLKFTPVSRAGERLPAKDLRIVGTIVRDVGAAPSEFHLGRQPVGKSVTEAVLIRSLTGQPFHILQATSKGGGADVARNGDGADQVYELRIKVTEVGLQETKAEFVVRHEDGVEYVVVVPIRCEGLAQP